MESPEPFVRLRHARDALLVGAFLLAIGAPLVDELVRDPETRGPQDYELRAPAAKPRLHFDVAELNTYPAAYEDWYLDQFGLRDKLLRWGSIERLLVFGVSPTARVEIGREGWMFYTGDWSREIFCGDYPMDSDMLAAWHGMLQNHEEVAHALGAKFLFVFGPNKETIYPDYVPRNWIKRGPTRLEQLDRWLAQHPGAHYHDLRPDLRAQRSQDAPFDHLYYELGTHWNGRGCYMSYALILSELERLGLAVHPIPYEEMVVIPKAGQGDTWARAMYISDLVEQQNLFVAPTRQGRIISDVTVEGVRDTLILGPDPKAPTAVMFHDSFGQSLEVLLAAHFSRLRCVWGKADQRVLEQERPDLVLEVYVERALATLGPTDNLMGGGDLARLCWDHAGRVLYKLDPTDARLLEQRGSIVLVPLPEVEGAAALRLDMPDTSGSIVLPRFELPAKGDLLVHIEVEASKDCELLVMPLVRGSDEPRRRRVGRAELKAGPNDVYLRLQRADNLERLLVHPVVETGRLTLRTFEVRAMPGS